MCRCEESLTRRQVLPQGRGQGECETPTPCATNWQRKRESARERKTERENASNRLQRERNVECMAVGSHGRLGRCVAPRGDFQRRWEHCGVFLRFWQIGRDSVSRRVILGCGSGGTTWSSHIEFCSTLMLQTHTPRSHCRSTREAGAQGLVDTTGVRHPAGARGEHGPDVVSSESRCLAVAGVIREVGMGSGFVNDETRCFTLTLGINMSSNARGTDDLCWRDNRTLTNCPLQTLCAGRSLGV